MKHDRVNYIAVGLFVLAMFGGLVALLFELSGGRGPTDSYYTLYRSVSGLQFGTPVYYEGFHVGQVEAIVPEHRDDTLWFRVEMSVRQGWRISRGSTARMVASGLLAAMSINIEGGTDSTAVPPGSTLPGAARNDLFAAVNEVAGEISSISNEALKPLLEKLSQRVDTLADAMEGHLPSLLENLNAFSRRLLNSATAVERLVREENVEQVDRALRDLAATAHEFRLLAGELRRNGQRFDKLVDHADRLLESAEGVVAGAARTVDDSRDMVRENRPDVRAATAELHHTLRTISARMDTILYNLDEASRNINAFSRTVRSNPSALLSRPQADDPPVDSQ